MSFTIKAFENRHLSTSLTLVGSDGSDINVAAGDRVRVQIGFDTTLVIESDTATDNGSTITAANPAVLTMVPEDLAVGTGVYDIDVDLFQASTGYYKRISTGIFQVQESVGSQCILSTADILTILQCKDMTSEQQAMMMQLSKLVEDQIAGELKYNPCTATHVETLPVIGVRQPSERLQLQHKPVRSITEVVVDELAYGGQAPNAFTEANGASILTQGVDYFMRVSNTDTDGNMMSKTGILERIGGVWACKPGMIRVTYVAGWNAAELRGEGDYHSAGTIKKAAIDGFASNFRELLVQANQLDTANAGIITSENFGDYSYTIDAVTAALQNFAVSLPSSSINMLSGHRHYGLIGA